MPAYVLVDLVVKDPEPYEEYRRLVPATITAYGGRYLARGGRTEVLESEWQPDRVVVLEFPTIERARQWLDSPEYSKIKHIRHRHAITRMMVAVEGMPETPQG